MISRPARALVTACLVAVALVSVVPAPAAALEPPRPLPGYRPAFVTETDQRPWRDCLWASGAMLLDKWTNGHVTRTHQQLRRLARDHRGGSTLRDLEVAYGRLGIPLEFSPDGGERITWSKLLWRLEHGAGAVLLGDYADLPRWYGRWDNSFWNLTEDEDADKDNHAVYIERYDRRRGRVWLMDPLARGAWKGEWISVRALRRFAWTARGGALSVAVTPTAKVAPYQGVTATGPKISMTSTTVNLDWLLETPRRWRFPGARVGATFERVADPLLAAAESGPVRTGASVTVSAPAKPVAAVTGSTLRATAALPEVAGAYGTTVTLTDRRFGRVVVQAEGVVLFVPGPRRATLRLRVRDETIEAGRAVAVSVHAWNTGTVSWADDPGPLSASSAPRPIRETRLVLHWIRLDERSDEEPPALVELRAVPLAAGQATTVRANPVAPETPGIWALVVDVTDDVDGSFAALGSKPAVVMFEVVAPLGVAATE